MSMYTIFVPGHVDRSKIQSCLRDACSSFVDIDVETFDAKAELKQHQRFIVLDNDYFVTYQKQHPEGVKCDYNSRNLIMSHIMYSDIISVRHRTPLIEKNGVWACEAPPVLYFVFRSDADALSPNNATEDNTIAEFYDSVKEEDFEKFAQVAKTKDSCVSHFFVVNRGPDYYAVDTSDPNVRCKFSRSLKAKIIGDLEIKKATIQHFIEEEKNLYKRKAPTTRDPNFQLRDCRGVPLNQDKTFALEIYNTHYEDSNDEESECEREIDCVDVFEDSPGHFLIHGTVGYAATFGFKVVDGITYLTYNNGYVCVSADERHPQLIVESEIPPKERRVHIHYANDGNILLSRWNGDSYVYCEWIKCSYGAIEVEPNEYYIRWCEPMKLCIIR
ncbi:hypothetical protein FB645_004049 [Coemansia sp. IMI 203386]|nr:hypothetical protein FB645_004049 [Coemansia sp. IMI 203386]